MGPKKIIQFTSYPYTPKPRASFTNGKIKEIIKENCQKYGEFCEEIKSEIAKYADFYKSIPRNKTDDYLPFLANGFLPLFDGIMIYLMLAKYNPALYFEIGSGNTTKFAAKSIADNRLRTKIISLDPAPRAEINQLCTLIFRQPLEEFDLEFFKLLAPDDILIIDCSHRAFSNSDVTVYITELLPILPKGVIYAIHDIYLPDEIYWDRYYNEQYMLAAYLLGGADGDGIIFPTHYLQKYTPLLKGMRVTVNATQPYRLYVEGSFFWMKRGG